MRLVLDAGAFVGFERGDHTVRAHLSAARKLGFEVLTTSPVVAQVWRNSRQVVLGKLLAATRVDAPDETAARRAGELLARSRTRDVVDALVVGLVRDGDTVLTSDPGDMEHLLEAARRSAHVVKV
jgi:hypothetical protein